MMHAYTVSHSLLMHKTPDIYLKNKSTAHCHLCKCSSRLNLRRCRIRHQRKPRTHFHSALLPRGKPGSPSHTCMSEEERPGSGCCSTHRPCSRARPPACSLGSARPGSVWFGSARLGSVPPDNLPGLTRRAQPLLVHRDIRAD